MDRVVNLARSRSPRPRRSRVDHSLFRRWLLVIVVATVVTAVVVGSIARAEGTRRRWGQTAPVVVLDRAVEPGHAVTGSARVEHWPEALVPAGTVLALEEIEDRVAAIALPEGVPVTPEMLHRVGDERRSEIAVPIGDHALTLQAGDTVSVWATYDQSLSAGRPTTSQIVGDARVESVSDKTVTVSVPEADTDQLVEAVALSTVTLVSERR